MPVSSGLMLSGAAETLRSRGCGQEATATMALTNVDISGSILKGFFLCLCSFKMNRNNT